jgi:hypothetical protein
MRPPAMMVRERDLKMKVSIALLFSAFPSGLISQSPPSATPAVMKWLQGLDAHKDGLDRMRGKLKASC